MGALFTAHHLGCKAIIALTDSGSTALWMSRHNIRVPIYGLTPQVAVQRRMALYRNVRPMLMADTDGTATATGRWPPAEARLLVLPGVLCHHGGTYAITGRRPMGYLPGGIEHAKGGT